MSNLVTLTCFLFVSALLVGFSQMEILNSRQCEGGERERNPKSDFHSLSITPCPQAPEGPCELPLGTNANLTIDFTPKIRISRRARQAMFWVQPLADLPFKGLPRTACGNMNCSAPSEVRRDYTVQIPLKPSYPRSTFDVKAKIYDGSKIIICRIFSIKLV